MSENVSGAGDETPLDAAQRAMTAAPEDEAARLAFYQRLADSALVLLLEPRPGADPQPAVFATGDGDFVLAFDDEARLAGFAGGPADYAAMAGRQIVRMLDGQDTGLGLNLGAPSEMLLPPEAIGWLARLLDAPPPEPVDPSRREIGPPRAAEPALLAALDAKLASAGGLAEAAWLCGSGDGLLLVYVGAAEAAEAALARAAGEALLFGGGDLPALDVGFAASGSDLARRVARVGLRYDLPAPEPQSAPARPAPGSDPDRPPILR